jgi:uncharacterized protein HemY
MVAIIGIFAFLVLVGLFFLLRGTGRLGAAVSPQERARHNARSAPDREEHRASGLN